MFAYYLQNGNVWCKNTHHTSMFHATSSIGPSNTSRSIPDTSCSLWAAFSMFRVTSGLDRIGSWWCRCCCWGCWTGFRGVTACRRNTLGGRRPSNAFVFRALRIWLLWSCEIRWHTETMNCNPWYPVLFEITSTGVKKSISLEISCEKKLD